MATRMVISRVIGSFGPFFMKHVRTPMTAGGNITVATDDRSPMRRVSWRASTVFVCLNHEVPVLLSFEASTVEGKDVWPDSSASSIGHLTCSEQTADSR